MPKKTQDTAIILETITKKEMKQKTVSECLTLIYDYQVNESAIRELKREELEHFILEIFNKGMLTQYLNL